jgi:hypothetical protein
MDAPRSSGMCIAIYEITRRHLPEEYVLTFTALEDLEAVKCVFSKKFSHHYA